MEQQLSGKSGGAAAPTASMGSALNHESIGKEDAGLLPPIEGAQPAAPPAPAPSGVAVNDQLNAQRERMRLKRE